MKLSQIHIILEFIIIYDDVNYQLNNNYYFTNWLEISIWFEVIICKAVISLELEIYRFEPNVNDSIEGVFYKKVNYSNQVQKSKGCN